jgi:hypothetical protein
LSDLGLEDEPYNWICKFLENRTHTTRFNNTESTPSQINASIVQGSPTGPVNFILNMTKLSPIHENVNSMSKYADDCYLIVPAIASATIAEEITHVEEWAASCNLKLNKNKTKEMVFTKPRYNRALLPLPLPGIERVETICTLGVSLNQTLSFLPHVEKLVSKGHQILYGVKLLKAHGLRGLELHRVTDTLLTGTILYACPAWWGFLRSALTSQSYTINHMPHNVCTCMYILYAYIYMYNVHCLCI